MELGESFFCGRILLKECYRHGEIHNNDEIMILIIVGNNSYNPRPSKLVERCSAINAWLVRLHEMGGRHTPGVVGDQSSESG